MHGNPCLCGCMCLEVPLHIILSFPIMPRTELDTMTLSQLFEKFFFLSFNWKENAHCRERWSCHFIKNLLIIWGVFLSDTTCGSWCVNVTTCFDTIVCMSCFDAIGSQNSFLYEEHIPMPICKVWIVNAQSETQRVLLHHDGSVYFAFPFMLYITMHVSTKIK